MDRIGIATSKRTPWWGQSFAGALKSVAEFLDLRSDGGAWQRFDEEVRELARPSLPLLGHKHTKIFESAGGGSEAARRWLAERDLYVDRILLPMLGAGAARDRRKRRRAGALVDRMIATFPCPETPPPVTWRVETGWAG